MGCRRAEHIVLELDLCQIASAKARRKTATGGLDYLLDPVRRELEERWKAAAHGDRDDDRRRVLLFDFDGADLRLSEAATIRRVSVFESGSNLGEPQSFDGVVMCLQPAWLDWEALAAAALRALRPGGALLFCTFGPDTLQELRWAWHQVDQLPHVHPFTDMHHIGDQLLQSGFIRPVVDADWVTVDYENDAVLFADLRAAGFTNIMRERRKTLTGKRRFEQFRKALTDLQNPGEKLAITYELIYGVATAPPSSGTPTSVAVAPPQPPIPRRD